MLSGNLMVAPLTVRFINKTLLYKLSYFTESYSHINNKIKIELDFSNCEAKSDLKGAKTMHISKFPEKDWFRQL